MIRVAGGAAAVVLLLAPAPVARAAEVYTFEAAAGARATFRVTETTRFSLTRAVVTTTGAYGGIALYDTSRRSMATMVAFRSMSAPAAAGQAATVDLHARTFRPDVVLSPGTYGVLVLGDTATRVTIPVDAGPGQTVVARTPHAQTFRLGRAELPAGRPATSTYRLPLIPGRTGVRTIALARVEPAYSRGPYSVVVCAARRGAPCGKGDTKVTHSGVGGWPVTGARVMLTGWSIPGRFLPGTRDLVATADFDPVVPATFTYVALQYGEW